MAIKNIASQLRTTDFPGSLRFFTEKLGFAVAFNYEDCYAGILAGDQLFHLKAVAEPDPSIPYVEAGDHLHLYFETDDVAAVAAQLKANGVPILRDVHATPWQTKELVIQDNQGHTLYFGEPL